MAEATIPVDLLNPGQVFACLGFLEAADVLLGDAEGGFDWRDESDTRFRLRAKGTLNPFEEVLEFLAGAEIKPFGPVGYTAPPPKKSKENVGEENTGGDDETVESGDSRSYGLETFETFPARQGDGMNLPIIVSSGKSSFEMSHWADDSGRETFKLYSGNRTAHQIARAMLKGVRKKPSKKQKQAGQPGDIKIKGLGQLWEEDRHKLIKEPLQVTTPMGGSFNFDPRGSWTAIDLGYSPNDQKPKHLVKASPAVEFLAAWGLQNARPLLFNGRQVRYAAWGIVVPAILARAALGGSIAGLPLRWFQFKLDMSGKNKIVTFAEEEIPS